MPRTEIDHLADEEFVNAVASVARGLVVAHVRGDQDAIVAELARLLKATARYANPEKRRDQALNRALAHT